MGDTLWELAKGYDMFVIPSVMLAGMITAFVWGYVIGTSQAEIDDETD